MRNPDLHDALRVFALDAADLLTGDVRAGAELDYDLDDEGAGAGPRLYHYRPLTAKFIADRWPRLRDLPSCVTAGRVLGSGAAAYLRVNGLRGEEAEPALLAMLERLYDDATDFTFPEARFERVYADVEQTLYESSQTATILVAVHGLDMLADGLELGDGVSLVPGAGADAPAEAIYGAADPEADPRDEAPVALLVMRRDIAPNQPLPIAAAKVRFRRLLTGLRLWKPGGIALGAVAWRRTGDGAWHAFEIEATGQARGEPWILVPGEETELRAFLDRIEKPHAGGAVAWALRRFEMGCGRADDGDALSDYLLALRALVDPADSGGRAGLALRVAVLCAPDGDRVRVQKRLELAQAFERLIMGDPAGADYLDSIGPDAQRTLVDEVERHLRSLLREVMGGALDPDLRGVADELLLAAVQDRRSPQAVPTPPTPSEYAAAFDEPEPEPEPELESEPLTTEIELIEDSEDEIGVVALEHDWDDPGNYSAPV